MEDQSSIEYLYKAVLKDFCLILGKIMKEKEDNENTKEEGVFKIDNSSIKDLLKDSLNFINNDSISKVSNTYYPNIYESLNKYLNDINEFLFGKETIENFPIIKADEHDIYRAYGFLCGIRVIIEGDLSIVSKFNYKELPYFEKFLNIYGNSKNITKNYELNFQEHKKNKKNLDLTLINKWIDKLDEKQLNPMKKNKKRKKKNKDNNVKNIKDSVDKNNLKENEEKDDYTNDFKNKINEEKKSDTLEENASTIQINNEENSKEKAIKDINEIIRGDKSTLEKGEDTDRISKIKTLNMINNENKNMILDEVETNNNNMGKESKIKNDNINEENNSVSQEQFIKENEKTKKEHKEDLIYIKEDSQISLDSKEGILYIQNKEEEQCEMKKDNENCIQSSIKIELKENSQEENKADSSNQLGNMNSNKKEKDNLDLSGNIQSSKVKKSEEDDNPIEALKKEMKELKEEVTGLKTGNELLNKRIQKLETNQLLLYHQISMYQTSRDIYKSIYYYFFDYLELKKICPNNFEKLKAVIDFIIETDENKLKTMQYDKAPIIPADLRQKLAKYFRLHFFLNKVSNKIVHRNFTEEQKRLLEEQNNDDILPLIPGFDFEQCFKTLEYYIENNIKNKQLKTVVEMVYNEKYINDKKLGPIKDDNGDVIKKGENGITFLMEKKDIEEIKNYFKSINIREDSFVDLCNNKLWDQEDL